MTTGSFPHDNFSSVYWIFTKLGHMIPLWKGRGRTLFILGSLGQRSRSLLLCIEFLTTGSFPHDNFSSVYWIFNKLGHMIPLWKEKNPIYCGVITIIPFDNLYRRAYFVMHTFLVNLEPISREQLFSLEPISRGQLFNLEPISRGQLFNLRANQ